MKEEKHKEEAKAEEHYFVTSHPPLLTHEPCIWLMITDGDHDSERHIFYSITEDRSYVRFVPELQNKCVACCYGGLLVLRDKLTNDCSILNTLTMETSQLPPLNIDLRTDCVISSPKMDGSCRIIFFDRALRKFWSCHLGDIEYIERESTYGCIFRELINFKGKLYALTSRDWNLMASDFSDPDLDHEQVICGRSLEDFTITGRDKHSYLVESCEDLLLIIMDSYDQEVSAVKIYKADFSIREWVKLETLGDKAIFLGSTNSTSLSNATAVGMKGNAVYWVRNPISWYRSKGHIYMYDIEDKSISMSLPFPIVGTYSYLSRLSWVSFPIICSEEKKLEQKDRNYVFEASPNETSLHVQNTELQIEQRKTRHREETETIGSTIFKKESLWADLQNDLLLEIFPHLFAGDMAVSRSVCRSWYSISPPVKTTQQFLRPLKSLDCSSPFLMCPDNKAFHPIHGELYSMDLPDIPGAKVRAARDGWLLMDFFSTDLFFYNPFTKAVISLPECDAMFYYSVYFSKPPTFADGLVVVAADRSGGSCAIYFKKHEDEDWTCREVLSSEDESFDFSYCNGVVLGGLYYFLGHDAKLLIFNLKKDEVCVIEAPKFISELKAQCGQQYMLESDGKLIVVFVGTDGSSVYPCEWNFSVSKWEVLESLGNVMLFVSRPLSVCKRAIESGTGNKIYFPRVVGDGHILFYSLATRRYHTFQMGTSYSNFLASKFYPQYNGWFMN